MWRRAIAADDATILALCHALNVEDPCPTPVDDAAVLRTLETLRREPIRGLAVVLELEGRAQGYALLISFWSSELRGEVCYVDELFVSPACRGRGWASRLIQDVAAGRGGLWPRVPVAVQLEVHESNVAARRLYERLGFERRNILMSVAPGRVRGG
jgi:ribosomal protein S18 acetylase RimI-like enzyme